MSKRIVVLINSLDGGGAERVVSTLLNELVKQYECYLILIENVILYEPDKRINLIHLNNSSRTGILWDLIRTPISVYKLNRIIKKYHFSQVTSFLHRSNCINIITKLFSKHKYKAIISQRIALSSMYQSNFLSFVSKLVIKYLYRKSDLIISVSKATAADLQYCHNITTKQVVIYNIYNLNRINQLSQEPVPEFIHLPINNENSIITVGSLDSRKNHKLLIQAFALLKDNKYKLYILGKGAEEDNLRKLAKSLNIERQVVFLEFDSNPYKYLARCGIFILSSNSEGFPNALAEAMACGCSVISTDCLSGPREILAPLTDINKKLKDDIEIAKYGILTPVNNVTKLHQAISLLLDNKELQKKYGLKSLKRVQDFKQAQLIEFKKVMVENYKV